MRCRSCGRLGVLCMLLCAGGILATTGCDANAPERAPNLAGVWSPTYPSVTVDLVDALMDEKDIPRWWARATLYKMSARTGSRAFWWLVDRLSKDGPEARAFYLAERIYRHDPSEFATVSDGYGFILLLEKADGYHLYVTGGIVHAGVTSVKERSAVHAYVCRKGTPQQFAKILEEEGVWSHSSGVLRPVWGGRDAGPWLVHLYRSEGQKKTVSLLWDRMVNFADLEDDGDLQRWVKREKSWHKSLSEQERARKAKELEADRKTYPGRLAVTGLTWLVLEAKRGRLVR